MDRASNVTGGRPVERGGGPEQRPEALTAR
jgi:hypothetical protein